MVKQKNRRFSAAKTQVFKTTRLWIQSRPFTNLFGRTARNRGPADMPNCGRDENPAAYTVQVCPIAPRPRHETNSISRPGARGTFQPISLSFADLPLVRRRPSLKNTYIRVTKDEVLAPCSVFLGRGPPPVCSCVEPYLRFFSRILPGAAPNRTALNRVQPKPVFGENFSGNRSVHSKPPVL